ncbi:MAG: hypothetical protein ACOYU3_07350 [Bacillota bacterium]
MSIFKKVYCDLNLRLFDGGEGGGGAATGAPGSAETGTDAPEGATDSGRKTKAEKNPLAKVVYGKQEGSNTEPAAKEEPAKTEPDTKTGPIADADADAARKAEFDRLINGDYKDLYTERTQKMINERFKQTKQLEAQSEALAPVLDMLAQKYGVDAKDVKALSNAIQEDDSYYEQEAYDRGLTVDQLKQMKKLERENAEFRRVMEERSKAEEANRIMSTWYEQAEQTKGVYPGFDLEVECKNEATGERFVSLLRSGVDVKTAYEVIHKDDLIGGAMQYTAQQVAQKVTNDIRARGMRPAENGTSGNAAAAIVKSDPSKFTRQDREEISRRVQRGERIVL